LKEHEDTNVAVAEKYTFDGANTFTLMRRKLRSGWLTLFITKLLHLQMAQDSASEHTEPDEERKLKQNLLQQALQKSMYQVRKLGS